MSIIKTPNNKSFSLKFELFPHQKETVKFMIKNPYSYILNQPGTGKTECAISTAMYHKLNEDLKKILIISKLSTLKVVWLDSINNHQLDLSPIVVHGTKTKKRKILQENKYNTYIINPDGIYNLEDLLLKIKFDIIIIDEATSFNNHSTNRYKTLLKMINKNPPKYFYLMTGTPTPNAPSDCFGMLKLFNPKQYTSFNRFRELVEKEVRKFTFVPLSNAYETISKLLQPAICFKKEEVLKDLKKTEFFFEEFKMSQEQFDLFKEMRKEFVVELENDVNISAVNAAIKVNKMLQIIGGSLIDEEENIYYFNVDNKLKKIDEIIENKIKNKTIIFCSHRAQLDILYKHLSKKYHCEIVSGSVSEKKRNDIFYKYQNTPEIDIIIAMPECMAHGITLTKSDGIIYYNPVFNNETYEQANARISRISQTETPKVFHLFCNSFDYNYYMKNQKRMSDQEFLLDLLSNDEI